MPRGKYAHEIVKAWVTGEGAGLHINGETCLFDLSKTPVVDTFLFAQVTTTRDDLQV